MIYAAFVFGFGFFGAEGLTTGAGMGVPKGLFSGAGLLLVIWSLLY